MENTVDISYEKCEKKKLDFDDKLLNLVDNYINYEDQNKTSRGEIETAQKIKNNVKNSSSNKTNLSLFQILRLTSKKLYFIY